MPSLSCAPDVLTVGHLVALDGAREWNRIKSMVLRRGLCLKHTPLSSSRSLVEGERDRDVDALVERYNRVQQELDEERQRHEEAVRLHQQEAADLRKQIDQEKAEHEKTKIAAKEEVCIHPPPLPLAPPSPSSARKVKSGCSRRAQSMYAEDGASRLMYVFCCHTGGKADGRGKAAGRGGGQGQAGGGRPP